MIAVLYVTSCSRVFLTLLWKNIPMNGALLQEIIKDITVHLNIGDFATHKGC